METFREKVLDFWRWFPDVAPDVGKIIHRGGGPEELSEFFDGVRNRVGGLAWVFGPGKSDDRLSFTVTGEGQVAKQLLSHFWLENAVEVPKWDFYCSRQASPPEALTEMMIDVSGQSVDIKTLMIATTVDEESQSVNIRAWHEVFRDLEDSNRFQILFLLLDESLGEYRTQTRLGDIEFKPDENAQPISELPAFLDSLWEVKGWEELSPLETYSGYQLEPTDEFNRSDTIAGYTCFPQVVLGYLNGRGALQEDPIVGTGAEYIYVQVDECGKDHLEDPLTMRTSIEEEVTKRLLGGGGYVVGGATGTQNSYIDVLIFDGKRSMAAIEEALEESNWHGSFELKKFNA